GRGGSGRSRSIARPAQVGRVAASTAASRPRKIPSARAPFRARSQRVARAFTPAHSSAWKGPHPKRRLWDGCAPLHSGPIVSSSKFDGYADRYAGWVEHRRLPILAVGALLAVAGTWLAVR